jgi:multidrug efflux pump
MGAVIAAGLSIGTMFTLFVVPAVYMVLSDTRLAVTKPGDAPPIGRPEALGPAE